MKKSGSVKPTKASKYLDVKTFTYYIPAPPARKSGYREREFDKIMHGILTEGHEVIDWKVQSVGGDNGGVYIFFLIGSTKRSAKGAGLDLHEKFGLTESHNDPNLEFIDHED